MNHKISPVSDNTTDIISINLFTVLPSVAAGIVVLTIVMASIISFGCLFYLLSWHWGKQNDEIEDEDKLIPFFSKRIEDNGMNNTFYLETPYTRHYTDSDDD